MPRSFTRLVAGLFSALGVSRADAAPSARQPLVVQPGDVIVQQGDRGWSAVLILEVDRWPDGSAAAHCLSYDAVATRPTLASLAQAPVRIRHAPIAAASFAAGWTLIGRRPVTTEDRDGFLEYLKLTDFPRYVALSGVDTAALVAAANAHYQQAYALGEQGQRLEAIAEYSRAIDLFPLFHEAIDNRAFTSMELGRHDEALRDFEASLRVHPDGVAAFFSRGECLMKLGRLDEAEAVFLHGLDRLPEQRALFTDFLGRVRTLRQAS